MMDEDFLNRKGIRWYKNIIVGAVIFAIVFMAAVIVYSLV